MKRLAKTRKVSAHNQGIELRAGALLEILITSKPTLLCVVRGAVERLAESLGFPDTQARAITLAVDEAITNIIRHSYGGRENKPIAIYFRKMQQTSSAGAKYGIEILLHDRGPAVDTAKLCGRDLNDIKPGGLGLHFIEECMDNVQYARVGKINQWKLRKFIQAANSQAAKKEPQC